MPGRYFEDFAVGDVVNLGTAEIDEDSIVRFAREYDPQPFHTDPHAATDHASFRGLVASGWQTAGIYMRLYVRAVLGKATSLGSPGVDKVRWPHPVRPGDTLRGQYTVLETRLSQSRPDRGIVTSRGELFNQNGDNVFSMESVNFIGRRPSVPDAG